MPAIASEPYALSPRAGKVLIDVRLPISDRWVVLPCAPHERLYEVAGRAAWMLGQCDEPRPWWTLCHEQIVLDPMTPFSEALLRDYDQTVLVLDV